MKRLITLLIFISFLFCSPIVYAQDTDELIPTLYAKGKVIDILEEEYNLDCGAGMKYDFQKLKVKVISGEYKGKIINIENNTSGNPAFDMWFQKGDNVLLFLEIIDNDIFNGYIVDFERDKYVFILIGLFVLSLILIGKGQGVKSVFTLGLTVLIIAKFLLPFLFKGYNPILLALITATIVTTLTLVIIGGFTKKSLAAILGTTSGLIMASLITIIIGKLANLKGLGNEEAQMLMLIPQEIQFDFRGLLFAGIIIGALGAVMDVSMSIASAMDEIKKVGQDLGFKNLIKSGMNVGKDIMGTMSNTLILAYTGTSIPLLLLFIAYQQPFIKLLNMDFLASEFIRALSGSIALILTIPCTALISALLMHKE